MKKLLTSILSCALFVSMCVTPAYAADNQPLLKDKTLKDAIREDLSNASGDMPIPASYNILNNVVAMSAGSYHSAAITANGALYTWGKNSFGQLGNGQTSERCIPVQIMSNVAYVSAGATHTAAITTDGTLWTWGNNGAGKLGNGGTVDSYVPIEVMCDVVSVSAGGAHTAALKKDGTLWMFGSNEAGQLANSTTTNALNPVCVMQDVSAVSCGEACTAIIKNDGSLWLCGNTHPSTQDSTSIFLTPTKIMDNVRSVSCGPKNLAVIKTDNSLWTWGDNNEGAVGIGGISGLVKQPTKIMEDVAQVAVGNEHMIALKTDGSVWGWGALYAGQAGNSIYNNANIVSDGLGRKVRHTPIKIIENAHYITAGHDHSFALEQNGSLWAWGNNAYGQLSNPEIKDSTYQWGWSYEGKTINYSEDIQENPISIGNCGTTLLPNVVNTISVPQ